MGMGHNPANKTVRRSLVDGGGASGKISALLRKAAEGRSMSFFFFFKSLKVLMPGTMAVIMKS